jgi:hypothetical protein
MARERYPGESRGLRLFLNEIRVPVEHELGRDALLLHAIRRALRSTSLDELRRARRLFNRLPSAAKQAIARGLVERQAAAEIDRDRLLETYSTREAAPFVCFEGGMAGRRSERPTVAMRHELLERRPLRVMVEPGSLPTSVARQLRVIADLIESNRRLLSHHHWRAVARPTVDDEDGEIDWA